MSMAPKSISRIALVLSMLIFLLSLTQDGICINNGCSRWPPWAMLILGPLEIMAGGFGAGVAWLANPMLFLAWALLYVCQNRAFWCAVGALGLALSLEFVGRVVASESGLSEPITHFAAGYWLWVSSMGIAAIGASLATALIINKRQRGIAN